MVSTTAQNVVSHKDELKEAYLFIFDGFAVTPNEFAAGTKHNQRFARELFATLVDQQLVVETEDGDQTAWQVTDPGTHDDVSREEAESRFDEVILGTKAVAATSTPKKAKAKEERDCLCGCGDKTKSLFKPGHDARFAGQLGRQIAAETTVGSNEEQAILDRLPSDALRVKALGIATGAREKASKKVASAAAKEAAKAAKDAAEVADPIEGTIKASKKTFRARKFEDGKVEAMRDGAWKPCTEAQTKSFTANNA